MADKENKSVALLTISTPQQFIKGVRKYAVEVGIPTKDIDAGLNRSGFSKDTLPNHRYVVYEGANGKTYGFKGTLEETGELKLQQMATIMTAEGNNKDSAQSTTRLKTLLKNTLNAKFEHIPTISIETRNAKPPYEEDPKAGFAILKLTPGQKKTIQDFINNKERVIDITPPVPAVPNKGKNGQPSQQRETLPPIGGYPPLKMANYSVSPGELPSPITPPPSGLAGKKSTPKIIV